MTETKFIITKDLRHFKSDYLHHSQIARARGYTPDDILETGVIIDTKIFILETEPEHLRKHLDRYIGNVLYSLNPNCFDIKLKEWLRGRELESQLYYSKRPLGILKEGD